MSYYYDHRAEIDTEIARQNEHESLPPAAG
ncbi:hypothetical protein COMA2_20043 [Candidatus Nitrospira nitrificans]|uniref:Uncharacterized protein n=1 Tax=Candidatus Nitrospira nitrificans TaxID=1742973 RepID=A0A0S4LEC3_9BACT|nr:hypothetical protein COMA2_20043 [Candidatus Nitrospira nitrificans]